MHDHGYELIMEGILPTSFFDSTIYTKIPTEYWHEQIEIIYVVRGNGIVTIDSKEIPIKTGDFCVINPFSVRTTEGLSPVGLHFYNIVISNSFCNHNGINIQNYTFDTKFSDSFLKQTMFELKNRYNDFKNPLYYARISAILLDFVIHLVENHSLSGVMPKSGTNYNISLAIGYIKENLKNKITVEQVAEQVGLSKSHFQRKFKQITGFSIVEYINVLRCDEACRFLRQNTYSVYDVFHMFPFDNYSYFAKMFKKHTGVSPSEYKKSFLKKELGGYKYYSQSTHKY